MAEENKPWENDPDGGSFGSWLRRQREVREITLREIAQESKISLRYLEAIEQDREGVLPAPVFVRGFLREYARFVGLDPDEVINYHMAAASPREEEEDAPPARSRRERQLAVRPLWLLGVLLVLLAIIAAFSYFSRSRSAQPNALVPPVGAELPDAPSVEVPDASAPIRLAMDFTQTSWVSVVIDGERAVSELRVQGESLRVEAEEELRVTLGNVEGVSFELNGQPFTADVGDDEELVIDLSRVQELEPSNEAEGLSSEGAEE